MSEQSLPEEERDFPDPEKYKDLSLFMVLVNADGDPETIERKYTEAFFVWHVHHCKPFPNNIRWEILGYMYAQLSGEDIEKYVFSKLHNHK